MRVIQTIGAQSAYYDRVGRSVYLYACDVKSGPHELELWDEYVVAEGRKAFIESIAIRLTRWTQATSVGTAWMRVLRVKGGDENIPVAICSLYSNDIGDAREITVSGLGVLLPGESLQIISDDMSQGGSVLYYAGVCLYEFV